MTEDERRERMLELKEKRCRKRRYQSEVAYYLWMPLSEYAGYETGLAVPDEKTLARIEGIICEL